MSASVKEVWVGLIGLKPRPGNEILGDVEGAYVYVMALASNEREYKKAVLKSLEEFGFSLEEMVDIESFSEKLAKGDVDEYLIARASQVARDGRIRYGEFFLHDGG